MLAVTQRDACYNMEFAAFGQHNDRDYLKKDAAMTSAIMMMVDQLKNEKDDSLDLTNLENIIDVFGVDDYEGEGDSFWDTLGVWSGMNAQSIFENTLSVV